MLYGVCSKCGDTYKLPSQMKEEKNISVFVVEKCINLR